MSRTKLRKARPKALFGEAAATLTAAGIQAAATSAAAAVQAKASRDAAKTQATNIKSAAEKQAEAIKAQSDSDKENTEKSLDLMREQHDEELAMQKDIQMDIQRAMGQQNEDARLEQGKIQVRNGGLAKGKGNRRLAMPHSFLQGGNMPFIITDGGNAIPLGTTPEGYNLYEVRGNDHEHYHKAQGGKNKTGVGFHFADGSVVEGEGNQNTNQGEYLLTTPTNAAFISKHSIDGFNPAKAINAGMNPMQAFLLQEQIKRANGISDDGKGNSNPPVKKNGGMIYTRGTSNILQPYYPSDLGRRTLKCGGRTKAGLGDFLSGVWNQTKKDVSDVWNHRANNAIMANLLLADAADIFNPISKDRYVQVNVPVKDHSDKTFNATVNVDPEGVGSSYINGLTGAVPVEFDKNGNAQLGYTEAGSRFSRGVANAAKIVFDAGKFARNKGMMQRIIQQNAKVPQQIARAQQVAARNIVNATAAEKAAYPNLVQQAIDKGIENVNTRVAQAAKQVAANNAANSIGAKLLRPEEAAREAQLVANNNWAWNYKNLNTGTSQLGPYFNNSTIPDGSLPFATIGDRLAAASDIARRTLSNAGRTIKSSSSRVATAARNRLASMKPATPTQARNIAQAETAAAGGTESQIIAAGQAAENDATNSILKRISTWVGNNPYMASSAGIAGLGIGGSLLYNAFAPNNNGMPSGPITAAAIDSAATRQQAQTRQSRQQRSIINNINNDSTSTVRNTATNVVNNNATNTVTNSPVSTSNDTASVNRKVAQQTSSASSQKASKQVSTSQATADAKANNETITFKNFNEAFDYYHKKYGNNGTFTFGGLKYGTKKETDKEAEARNRRWGARRTEESLAAILGDVSNKSDNDIWNIYLNRKDRRQTKFGGSVRPQFAKGGSNNVNLNGIYDLAGAGINALGNLGGAFLATRGNNSASKYLSNAYNQAGNILANAYNSMTGIDSDYLKQSDFKSAHMMPALQAVTSNAAAPLAEEERSRLRTLRNAGRYSASGAAAINRMNTAETDSRDVRTRIYALDTENQDKIRERNAQALNDAAKFNAQADIDANKNYLGYKTDILKYNNDIANTRRLGAAQSMADALTQSSSAMATARQSNGNAWMSALSSSGNSFANAISTIGKRVADYNNIMAGTDIGAQVGAVVSNNDGNKAASIYQNLDFSKPIDRDYGMQLERQFPFLKGTNSTGTALEWKDKPSKQDTPTSINTQLTPQNSLITMPPYDIRYPRGMNVFFN